MCLFGGVLWLLHITNSPTWPGPVNEVGDRKDWLCKGHWAPISFPNTTSPRKAPGWGMRPTALGVLPLASESRTRFVPLKIHSPGCGPSGQAAPVWCPVELWAEGGPSRKLVSCRGCRHCRAGLSPEARVTERPGPLGGQPGVGARLCNLKLEKVIKKDILRQGENGSGLEPGKLTAWESDYLGNSN